MEEKIIMEKEINISIPEGYEIDIEKLYKRVAKLEKDMTELKKEVATKAKKTVVYGR